MADQSRLVFGFMTGTSIDALDGAAVRITGTGLAMRASLAAFVSRPLGALVGRLRALASGEATSAGDIARLSLEFATAHVEAVRALRNAAGAPGLLAVHGQTVFHAPPASWQMLNPWPIAREAACPLVFDLRGADLAAGGQGAPITPLADWVLLRADSETRAVVNLGGFCNATILPRAGERGTPSPEGVEGLDVCACNHVLDEIARRTMNAPFDEDGRTALRGRAHVAATAELTGALNAQAGAGRSLGAGDEARHWIDAWLSNLAPPDLAASAVEGLAAAISGSLTKSPSPPDRILLAGGGVRNRALAQALARACPAPVEPTDAHGAPAQAREAMEIAILGALCADGVPVTLPRVTRLPAGAPAPIAGAWVFPHGTR